MEVHGLREDFERMSYEGARVTIKRVANGWIVRGKHDEHVFVDPSEFDENSFVDSLRDAMYQVIEELEADPGDHASKRLYLIVAPGDEREDFPQALMSLR